MDWNVSLWRIRSTLRTSQDIIILYILHSTFTEQSTPCMSSSWLHSRALKLISSYRSFDAPILKSLRSSCLSTVYYYHFLLLFLFILYYYIFTLWKFNRGREKQERESSNARALHNAFSPILLMLFLFFCL